jgi:hypothetical protein
MNAATEPGVVDRPRRTGAVTKTLVTGVALMVFAGVVNAFSQSPGFAAVVALAVGGWLAVVVAARFRPEDTRLQGAARTARRHPKGTVVAPLIVLAAAGLGLTVGLNERAEQRRGEEQVQRDSEQQAEHDRVAAEKYAQRQHDLLANASVVIEKVRTLLNQVHALKEQTRFSDALGMLNAAREEVG